MNTFGMHLYQSVNTFMNVISECLDFLSFIVFYSVYKTREIVTSQNSLEIMILHSKELTLQLI